MFGSAPGVHDQVFQLYISMLEGLIVDGWSAAEYLRIFFALKFELFRLVQVRIQATIYKRRKTCEQLL